MTPVNSSLLGYVFIIGGIALAILAYAVYINLREAKSKSKLEWLDENVENENESFPTEKEPSLPDTPLIETPFTSTSNKDPATLEELPGVSQLESTETEMSEVNMPQQQELISIVTILREIDSGDLILRIGETDYTSFEDLKDSPHLSRIMRLTTDLDNWLKPTSTPAGRAAKSVLQTKASETDSFSPRSMVEEINDILERKLREEPGKRKAIKLVEMLDGGVNVYIGVDSYPIDEVPFEDVQQLIRQAVSEWEQSQ